MKFVDNILISSHQQEAIYRSKRRHDQVIVQLFVLALHSGVTSVGIPLSKFDFLMSLLTLIKLLI